jgi:hypothetical protein
MNKSIINNSNNSNDIVVELPIKKKGRKSKKTKLLELELEKSKLAKIVIRNFPTFDEKIFDVVMIGDIEYFYDSDFNLLLDKYRNPVGFKNNFKYVFYSELNRDKNKIEQENEYMKKIMNDFNLA